MSTVINLHLKARDDSYDELVAYMAEILPDTAALAGAELISCWTDPEAKTIVVHEVWDAKASQESYVAWRVETGVVDKIVAMLAEPPVFDEKTHVPY